MTHRNLWSNSAIFGWHTGVSDRDTYLHTLPMFHCNGWGMPYALTAMGVPQVVLRKVDGADILRASTSTASRCCAARRRWWPWCSTPRRRGTGRSRATGAHGSSWPAPRRPPAPSSGSRPSSAGR